MQCLALLCGSGMWHVVVCITGWCIVWPGSDGVMEERGKQNINVEQQEENLMFYSLIILSWNT